jgi:hypothetical protein
MRTDEVLAHYKTQQAIAAALNIKQPSVAVWGEFPPPVRQLQLERLTDGVLKAEADCEARVLGLIASGNANNKQKARA